MNLERQKRQSCELCRSRKLKCTGEKTGCSRCRSLSLKCRFHDKGTPGRPRTHLRTEPGEDRSATSRRPGQGYENDRSSIAKTQLAQRGRQRRRLQQYQQQQRSAGLTPEQPTIVTHGPLEFNPTLHQGLSTSCGIDSLLIGHNGSLEAYQSELANQSNLFELLGPCISSDVQAQSGGAPELVGPDTVPSPELAMTCECAREVFATLRSLRHSPTSHHTLANLRLGTDLVETLLTCPVCYDLAKPPRVTIQNVLLIGRLILEITSSYGRYLRWLEEWCEELDSNNESETIFLFPDQEASTTLSFKLSGPKFRDLVTHGLRTDTARLSRLGNKFALRQQNRHTIGHEACPDAEGRCWKEEYGVDLDPLDICPKSTAAKTLIPCFRVVEEVQTVIKRVVDQTCLPATS